MRGLSTVTVLGGEGGGWGGRAMRIAAMEGGEGRPGGGWTLGGIRRCGVDECVRRTTLLRCGMVSCVWAVYGGSEEGMSECVCEEVDRPWGFVVR